MEFEGLYSRYDAHSEGHVDMVYTRPGDDSEAHMLVVAHVLALDFHDALEYVLRIGRHHCRASAPRARVARSIRDLARRARQSPRQRLHVGRALEGRIAIGRFLQRFPDDQLPQAPVRGGRARFRGFLHAPFSTR